MNLSLSKQNALDRQTGFSIRVKLLIHQCPATYVTESSEAEDERANKTNIGKTSRKRPNAGMKYLLARK